MKKTVLLLTLCCAMIACKKHTVDFTYFPEMPKAGEKVSFNNHSSTGQKWEWQFGDGGSSTLKTPVYTYRKPGTYLVKLKVDNKSSLTCSKTVVIYDTVPTFTCKDSVFSIYKDYTFIANLYNPYNYPVSYQWTKDGKELGTGSTLKIYFTEPDVKEELSLRVIMNSDTTEIIKGFYVHDVETNSVLLRTDKGDYRQRIFGARAEEPKMDLSAALLLDLEQDTIQVYNGYEFKLSELKTVFPELEGFHIASRKIYLRAGGLYVAHIDGSDIVEIDGEKCPAMTLDTKDNRIYWANKNGVWYMPFVGSDNNQFITTPTLLNSMNNVIKIAADAELR